MQRSLTSFFAMFCLFAVMQFMGCSDQRSESGDVRELSLRGGIDGGGAGNPASEFCVKQHGIVEIYSDKEGQSGYCVFENASISEWTLYYYFKRPSQDREEAIVKFLANSARPVNGTKTSPDIAASNYCKTVGGNIAKHDTKKGPKNVCVFKDQSGIEARTLYLGTKDPANAKLVKILARFSIR